MVFLMLPIFLLSMPMANAAGAITLTPTAQAPGASVSVDGTGFGETKTVGIGLGAEVAVTGEITAQTGSGLGPYIGTLANRPIKPGTFVLNVNVNNGAAVYDVTDNGAGGLTSTFGGFASGTIDYVTGQFSTYASTEPPSGSTIVKTARYTSYQYNVTPAVGVATDVSGSFTANITVPILADGNYSITAIDAQGNLATANLSVDTTIIPEGLTVGVMMLLSSVAVIVSSRYFRKRPKSDNCSQVKL